MALAANLVYEKGVRRTLESGQGDATIDEEENSPEKVRDEKRR
jgi:hypothetical protein